MLTTRRYPRRANLLSRLSGSELRVRFIFNPLQRLAVKIKGEITLSGLRDVEALEYRFKKVEEE